MSSTRYTKGDEAMISRMPPPKNERIFRTFLWNPKTKTVMGRTASSWAGALLFYTVFYAFLAGFFSLMMAIFYQTLNDKAPTYTGADSVLANPGLGFRPSTDIPSDLRSTITYSLSSTSYSHSHVYSIDKFMKKYESNSTNGVDCQPGDGYRKEGDEVCNFDMSIVNTICKPDRWGYNTTSPCIFLKLNKVFHWKPQALKSFEGLPEGLQRHINATTNPEETLKQNVWVWCESEEIEMEQPAPGLPFSFFPYLNQKGYLAPFVPVRLNLTVGQTAVVQCRVWASNVPHTMDGRQIGQARITFNVLE